MGVVLAALGFGTVSAAQQEAGPAPPSAVQASSTAGPVAGESTEADVAGGIAEIAAGLPRGTVSVAAFNTVTARTYGYDADDAMDAASLIKLDVVEALVLQHQDSGVPLSDDTVALATTMIENSDNDAASALWDQVGGAPGVADADQRFGLSHTVPDPDGQWGLSTTDAADQLALLANLIRPGPLDGASRSFVLGLMQQVESDQNWGVSAAADPGTTTALKNGWLDVDDDGGLWAVASVGSVTVHGQQVLLAVLTRHNASEAAGIQLVESLARAATC